ncbi:hypothetical protein IWQ62_003076 [Dispira parvispora]|uniref:Uncharacterized protein n=1 Tax=Dispira parvispora TaxID=1520584 RepID=A0A9W8AUM4_9FUNG|nr:hypothetical protein IWQ62_003076 [Dispira parvispora]
MEGHKGTLSQKRAASEDLSGTSKRPAYDQFMSNLPTLRMRSVSPISYVGGSTPATRENSVEYESRWEIIREQITPQNVKTLQGVIGSTGHRMFLPSQKGERLPPFSREDFYRVKALMSQYKTTKNLAVFSPDLFERLRDRAFSLRRVASWDALRHTRASFSDVEIVDMGEEFENLAHSAYKTENGTRVRVKPIIPSEEYLAGFYKRYGIEASFVKKWFANAQNRELPATYKRIMGRSRNRYSENNEKITDGKIGLEEPYHPLVYRAKYGVFPSDGKSHEYDLSTQRNNIPVSLAPKVQPSGVNGKRHPSQSPVRRSKSPQQNQKYSSPHVDRERNDTARSRQGSNPPPEGSLSSKSSEVHTAKILLGLSSTRPTLPSPARYTSVPMRSTAGPRYPLAPLRNIRPRGRIYPSVSAVRSTLPSLWSTVPHGKPYAAPKAYRSGYDARLIARLNRSL